MEDLNNRLELDKRKIKPMYRQRWSGRKEYS